MARRRPRPAPPPRRSARGVLPWLGVLGVATLLGWVWWRAAYRPTAAASWAWADTWSGMRTWVDGLFPERRGTVEEEPAEEGGWGTDPSEAEAAGPTIPAIASPRLPGVQVPPSQRSSAVEEGRFVLTNAVSIPVAVDTGNVANPSTPASGVGETPDLRSSELARKEGTNILTVQLALARRGISAGPIDGVVGSQTRAALRVFQKMEGLPVTGVVDDRTLSRLAPDQTALTNYVVTSADIARLTWVPSTWMGKASRERLDYESILELVSEKNHAHPKLVRQLNPGIRWNQVRAGTSVVVPASALPPLRGRAGFVRISLSEKALRVFDPRSNLVAHFPCSIARKVEKRPVGELKVVRLAPNPNYRFDPEIFRESPEARKIGRKLMIPPGPNNPVGTAWVGLSRPGYGIHGTPNPEDVGRTESHGCFRLANWNAEFLIQAAWVGMPVFVEP